MILDRLETSAAYGGLGERFAAAFAYLRQTDLAALADGTYAIRGDDVYAIVQAYTTKPRAEGRWEAHRVYADIQYIISGAEVMGIAPLSMMVVETPYDAERDVEFFRGGGQTVIVEAGEFTVFLPHDVHMPSISMMAGQGPFTPGDEEPKRVKKVVVKVRLR